MQTPKKTPPDVDTLTPRDIIEILRLAVDRTREPDDGITATAADNPTSDLEGASEPEGALLVTFTDTRGRQRLASVEITDAGRDDACACRRTSARSICAECARACAIRSRCVMTHPTLSGPSSAELPPRLRTPYVGDGVDGALRSAQIDRSEADGLDPGLQRDLCLASAQQWLLQAQLIKEQLR